MRTPPKILRLALIAAAVVGTLVTPVVRPAEASCGTQPFVGQICTFAFNFCPKGFLLAAGQLLPIANENVALFAVLGNVFGGDGRTTFALPDLRGRTAVGSSPSLPVGTTGGDASTVNLRAASSSGVQVPATQSPFVGLTRCIALSGIFPPHQ